MPIILIISRVCPLPPRWSVQHYIQIYIMLLCNSLASHTCRCKSHTLELASGFSIFPACANMLIILITHLELPRAMDQNGVFQFSITLSVYYNIFSYEFNSIPNYCHKVILLQMRLREKISIIESSGKNEESAN